MRAALVDSVSWHYRLMSRIAIKQLEQLAHKSQQLLVGLLFTRTMDTSLDTPTNRLHPPSKPGHPHEMIVAKDNKNVRMRQRKDGWLPENFNWLYFTSPG